MDPSVSPWAMGGNAEAAIRIPGFQLSLCISTRNTEERLSRGGVRRELSARKPDIVPETVKANNKNFPRPAVVPFARHSSRHPQKTLPL